MRSRARVAVFMLATALIVVSPTVSAGVPSPANSQLPDCLVLCPMGDIPLTVVVRDLANNTIANSLVVLDFSSCPSAYLCPGTGEPGLIVDLPTRTLRALTGATGSVTMPAHVGGTGPAGSVRVFADGVLLRSYGLATPDQNGNGVAVTIVDIDDVLFAAKLGTTDLTADFDCSGHVDAADQLIFFSHLSQACSGFVDAARRSTWAQLKLHYR
jgi:hypothetical protein